MLGALRTCPALDRPDLLAPSVAAALGGVEGEVSVDVAVAAADLVVVGSGVRRSTLVLAGALLAALPGVEVLDLAPAG